MSERDLDRDVVVETEKKLQRPSLFKVLLHNDDYTTKEFVSRSWSSSSTRTTPRPCRS